MARRAGDDSGQLMMLAGIVLTISFILTSLTLSQVSSLERAAASEDSSPLLGEWRFLHDRLASNLETATSAETTLQSFKETIMPSVAATFRAVEAEKGYDLTIRLAGGADHAATGNEASLLTGNSYANWSYDGSTHFTHAQDADTADGVIMQAPCPENGAPAGCISGVYLYVRLADPRSAISETILFAVNQP